MEELYHHGIAGMKWGVRRYQNKDGSLTSLGEKRFKKVSRNERIVKKQTKMMIKSLTEEKEQSDKKVSKFENKVNKYSGKNDKATKKYSDRLNKQSKVSDMLSKKISDIESGTKKAGRDFIIQKKTYKIPYVYIGLMGPKVSTFTVGKNYLIEKK